MTSSDTEQLAALEELGVVPPVHRRVLLVDDERDNLEVLGATLEEDFDVHVAAGGPGALALLESVGEFAVVVSDQRMPGMTGVELLAEIARRSPETVRIVLTAYSDVEPIVAAIHEGSVYRFLLKPWDPHEMRSAVRDALWLHRARAVLRRLVELLFERRRALTTALGELAGAQADLLATERLSTLGGLTSGVMHNIRNNLTVMANVLELIQRRPPDETTLRTAQASLDGLHAVMRLIGDLGAFARGRAAAGERTVAEVAPFLDETCAAFAAEPLGRGRTVTVEVEPGLRVLSLSPDPMRRGLLALLRNAARASAPEAPIRLRVGCYPGGTVIVDVADAGCGMTPDTLAQAQRPFWSGFEPRGLGLGLEMARAAAEAHGGRITFVSSPGEGTRVRLWLHDDAARPAAGAR